MTNSKKRLFELIQKEGFKRGDFLLSSGKKSNYYIDCRKVTLSPEGAYLSAFVILNLLENEKIDAIGGPTIGADPILGAIAALSYLNKKPIKTFLVRSKAKEHGTTQQIEGPTLNKGAQVVIIDDVATSGKSLINCIYALKEIGVGVKKAICLVDRNEGAKENLSKEGCQLISIFNIQEFLK
jgi:orotate phosphoribosyltransferase